MAITLPEIRRLHYDHIRALVRDALDRCGWSLTTAAKELDITVSTLQRALKHHELYDEYRERTGNRGPGKPRRAAS